ncbi:NUDIX domain-containing protein [Fodinibius sp.]|uniref:NUDIX domain-containing protein n=1 Tax=Fodinibius sp. TaxID=1872440 RepID=UPI002ACEC3D7|nr:NUDIX domain-containing protein [Fodinibius sp.]MDZ7660248.1 NUDIX domain-containing protein [Fodinibius sp.]
MKRLVDVYPYQREQNEVEFLIFKRAADVQYAHQWRMIGGKVNPKETYYNAALRELKEETGLSPDLFWSIPSVNQFYDPDSDRILQIPAFGAEVNKESAITLNHEHASWKWISEDELDTYIQWPEQIRLMKLLADIVISKQILNEWIIEL